MWGFVLCSLLNAPLGSGSRAVNGDLQEALHEDNGISSPTAAVRTAHCFLSSGRPPPPPPLLTYTHPSHTQSPLL